MRRHYINLVFVGPQELGLAGHFSSSRVGHELCRYVLRSLQLRGRAWLITREYSLFCVMFYLWAALAKALLGNQIPNHPGLSVPLLLTAATSQPSQNLARQALTLV